MNRLYLEEKTFLPLGSDEEAHSDFQLIAGTNRDLFAAVREGKFREDLLARINLWTFLMPGLKNRTKDIEPNLDFELDRFAEKIGRRVTFCKEARRRFLDFALSPAASWAGNFRDLNAAVARMATLARGGRISTQIVDEEASMLSMAWQKPEIPRDNDELVRLLTTRRLEEIDLFDRAQLAFVVDVCKRSRSLSERQNVLSSVPLALASRFQTMRIGSANTSVALIWNFRRSKNLTARILEARTCGPNQGGRSGKKRRTARCFLAT